MTNSTTTTTSPPPNRANNLTEQANDTFIKRVEVPIPRTRSPPHFTRKIRSSSALRILMGKKGRILTTIGIRINTTFCRKCLTQTTQCTRSQKWQRVPRPKKPSEPLPSSQRTSPLSKTPQSLWQRCPKPWSLYNNKEPPTTPKWTPATTNHSFCVLLT